MAEVTAEPRAKAIPAAAQTETGRITGIVTDATGGILPGVTVNAKAVGTGATRTVVTDTAGRPAKLAPMV